MFKKVIKNTSLLSFGTLVSLFFGFIRDVLVAFFFGTSRVLEAFIVAFRLPNLFRSIFGEGFQDAVAVPILSEHKDDKKELFAISNHLISLFLVVLALCTVIGIVFCKYFVLLLAPGFIQDPQKFYLTVSFSRITFLYLFLIGISVTLCSVLYSLKQFFVPAINSAFLNLAFIIGISFFAASLEEYILVACVVAGGILQILLPFFILRKQGWRFHFSFKAALRNSQIVRMVKLFGPRIFSSIVYHLSVYLDTVLSSFTSIVGAGALCAIHFANRFVHVPLALIALPIARVAVVDLSSHYKNGEMQEFKTLLMFSFENLVLFVVPISVVFLVIPHGIVDVVFARGDFDAYSLSITSSVLFYYAFGLFFFCTIKLLLSAFYSLKDTLTPAKTTGICLLINAALSIMLMKPLKIGGVALGSSIAAFCNCLFLYYKLVKKVGPFDWKKTKLQFFRIALLSALLGLLSFYAWDILTMNKYGKFLCIATADAVVFLVVGFFLGIRQLAQLKHYAFRRR